MFVLLYSVLLTAFVDQKDFYLKLIKAQHGGNRETLEAYGSDWQGEGPVLLFCRRTDL